MLLALVDADYKFLYVDIGCNGRVSDGGVFKNSSLYAALENNTLHLPNRKALPGQSQPMPYTIVADDAFPLKDYLLKPYSLSGLTIQNRVFNYRLSRARRIVENAFGILANRFRIFMAPIALKPEKVEAITLACCSLHNFLRTRIGARCAYTPSSILDSKDSETHSVLPGNWRQGPAPQGLLPLVQQGSNRYSDSAKDIRDHFRDFYFSNEGSVPWQWDMI